MLRLEITYSSFSTRSGALDLTIHLFKKIRKVNHSGKIRIFVFLLYERQYYITNNEHIKEQIGF